MGSTTPAGDRNPNMDYEQHDETYGRFLRFTKIGIVFLVALLASMYIFLVPHA